MSDLGFVNADRIANDAACCVNDGCGNRFDPAREGFNGECDSCAALAADHFSGAHSGLRIDCPFCWDERPVTGDRVLVAA
jgi:hypothetical protein